MFLELLKWHDSCTILAFKSELLQQIVEELVHDCKLSQLVTNCALVDKITLVKMSIHCFVEFNQAHVPV